MPHELPSRNGGQTDRPLSGIACLVTSVWTSPMLTPEEQYHLYTYVQTDRGMDGGSGLAQTDMEARVDWGPSTEVGARALVYWPAMASPLWGVDE